MADSTVLLMYKQDSHVLLAVLLPASYLRPCRLTGLHKHSNSAVESLISLATLAGGFADG